MRRERRTGDQEKGRPGEWETWRRSRGEEENGKPGEGERRRTGKEGKQERKTDKEYKDGNEIGGLTG